MYSAALIAQTPTVLKTSSLREFEEQALRRNVGLLAGKYEVRQAESDIITAGLRPNPVATLNADIFPLPGEQFNPNNKQYGLSVALPIELANKREYRLETAQNLAIAQKAFLENSARQVLLAVRLAYFDALGAQEQLRIADANVEAYQKLVALNEVRYKATQISQTELSRSELALEQAELQRKEAALTATKAERALLFAIGDVERAVQQGNESLMLSERLQPMAADSAWNTASLDNILKQALVRRQDVKALKVQREAAFANQRLQEANAVPDVSIAPEVSMQQGAVLYGFTGYVALPFNNRNEGERQKAQFRVEQTQQQIALAELTVRNEVQTAFAEYQTRSEALKRYRLGGASGAQSGILTRAAGIKNASELAYKAGSISLLELLDAVRIFNEIYKSYIDAVTLFNKSVMTLVAVSAADVIAIE